MLNIKIGNGGMTLEHEGPMIDLIAELSFAVHTIYNGLADEDPLAAEAFRAAMTATFSDSRSPLWARTAAGAGAAVRVEEVPC